MHPITHRIPLDHLLAPNAVQLTREFVIDLARKVTGKKGREVHILVVVDNEDDEAPIEVAAIGLNYARTGNWWLQYVSHPAQSRGLTKSIIPCSEDFAAFASERVICPHHPLQAPRCAQTLQEAGLGPLASLDLRLRNPVPVVPTMDDLVKLVSLVGRAPFP